MEKTSRSGDWLKSNYSWYWVKAPLSDTKSGGLQKYFGTVFLLLLIGSFSVKGQDYTPEDRYLETEIEPHRFNREKWAKAIDGISYDQKSPRQKSRNQDAVNDNEDRRGSTSRSGDLFGAGTGTALAQFLLIAGGIVLIAFLIWSILGYDKQAKNKKIKRKPENIDIRKIEENIHEADMNDYIRQAKEVGDFNLAVRLYYLAALKELSLKKHIKWKVDKTNGEYLREMRSQPAFDEFRSLTRIFEQSWYGNRPLDADFFAELEPRFDRFIQQQAATVQATAS